MTSYILSACKIYLSSYSCLSKSCWQGIILGFINALLGGMFYFFSTYFVNDLQLSLETTGLIIACYGMGTIIGGFLGGKISDRFSPNTAPLVDLLL